MKTILLASASVLAFAGVAAAQDEVQTGIIFGGDASFGFNSFEFNPDSDVSDEDRADEGFFYEANLAVTLRSVLDSGAVAESTFTIPIADSNLGNDLSVDNDFLLGLSIDGMGSIQLGDTTFAAEDTFSFATMQSADFSEQDGETTLKGTTMFGGVTVAASAVVTDGEGDEPGARADTTDDSGTPLDPTDDVVVSNDTRDFIDQISVGAAGDIGRFSFSAAYQEESDVGGIDESGEDATAGTTGVYDPDDSNGDFNPAEQAGISLGTNFAGFDVQVGYGRNMTAETDSYGVSAGFPVGPITLTAEYVVEPDAEVFASDDNENGEIDSDEAGSSDYSYAIGAEYATDRILISASFGEEIGEEEYDIKVGYAVGPITTLQAGYNDDDGGFVAVRQGLGAGAFVEASYAEADDAGFGNSDFGGTGLPDDIREGATLKVGLEF